MRSRPVTRLLGRDGFLRGRKAKRSRGPARSITHAGGKVRRRARLQTPRPRGSMRGAIDSGNSFTSCHQTMAQSAASDHSWRCYEPAITSVPCRRRRAAVGRGPGARGIGIVRYVDRDRGGQSRRDNLRRCAHPARLQQRRYGTLRRCSVHNRDTIDLTQLQCSKITLAAPMIAGTSPSPSTAWARQADDRRGRPAWRLHSQWRVQQRCTRSRSATAHTSTIRLQQRRRLHLFVGQLSRRGDRLSCYVGD